MGLYGRVTGEMVSDVTRKVEFLSPISRKGLYNALCQSARQRISGNGDGGEVKRWPY
jgi:hypothetical protein